MAVRGTTDARNSARLSEARSRRGAWTRRRRASRAGRPECGNASGTESSGAGGEERGAASRSQVWPRAAERAALCPSVCVGWGRDGGGVRGSHTVSVTTEKTDAARGRPAEPQAGRLLWGVEGQAAAMVTAQMATWTSDVAREMTDWTPGARVTDADDPTALSFASEPGATAPPPTRGEVSGGRVSACRKRRVRVAGGR